jgi:8-oxo-dGTP diphosphatase
MRAVQVHLVRHAHAGSRSSWDGSDADRPLSTKGMRQATGLRQVFEGQPVGAIVSSPALRCIQTVEPLADERNLTVVTNAVLLEGSAHDAVIAYLLEQAPHGVVACSHGDIIPKVVRRLVGDGMEATAGALSQKGSVWSLTVEDGRFVAGTYAPPEAAALPR